MAQLGAYRIELILNEILNMTTLEDRVFISEFMRIICFQECPRIVTTENW